MSSSGERRSPALARGNAARRYARLKQRGKTATLRGDFEAALECFQQARELVAAGSDATLVDEADLNLSMVWLQRGEARKGEEGLREILLRSRDDPIALAAAYNLASSLRKQGRHERALVYARRALERANKLGAPDGLAMVHNLIGNILLTRSYLDEALAEYQTALELRNSQQEDTRYSRAILLENLGYCLLLKRRIREGLSRIRTALGLAEEVGDRRCQTECLQDLCYGLLLAGRHREAIGLGTRALGLAQEADYRDIEENCHYLLGELGNRTGKLEMRDRHFEQLQSLHPELPFLRDFLCAVDVTQIITLKR
jgi:tetratricopeptide (TPR) repeat protein